jgi:hypothetical protein
LNEERMRSNKDILNNGLDHYNMSDDSDEECLAMIKRSEVVHDENQYEAYNDDQDDEEEKENSYSSNNLKQLKKDFYERSK